MAYVEIQKDIRLYYEEYGTGDKIILSAQVGFYKKGMQQAMADKGYHVYCITLRGFAPSSYISEDYGDKWYDIFAEDVIRFADYLNINRFVYMGASHGAGVGWHILRRFQDRVKAFLAIVPGPHSLKEGTMSYRQMLQLGIIEAPPPFDPPIDQDDKRVLRRLERENWLKNLPQADPLERAIDYGRPLMDLRSEEKLCEALRTMQTPTLLIGGIDDPISTPELMFRTAKCLPHCKLIMYANCGHNIDTDLIEEVTLEACMFLEHCDKEGKWYHPIS